ncbi:hypothetical protein V491_00644 [Pseudogymnoascus sp. VKM F-3775]|nr:hypothetical protein V491_00644 [Pseudogymnoascus sp. VKM F-3775]
MISYGCATEKPISNQDKAQVSKRMTSFNMTKPCSRCTTRAETTLCVYEIHMKHAKEELMKQIHEVRSKNKPNERVVKALQYADKAPDILRALSNGDSLESIVDSLGRQPQQPQG